MSYVTEVRELVKARLAELREEVKELEAMLSAPSNEKKGTQEASTDPKLEVKSKPRATRRRRKRAKPKPVTLRAITKMRQDTKRPWSAPVMANQLGANPESVSRAFKTDKRFTHVGRKQVRGRGKTKLMHYRLTEVVEQEKAQQALIQQKVAGETQTESEKREELRLHAAGMAERPPKPADGPHI